MSASRGSSGGADPARVADQDAELLPRARRHRAARERNDATSIPIDVMADPEATRAAIRAKYGDRPA